MHNIIYYAYVGIICILLARVCIVSILIVASSRVVRIIYIYILCTSSYARMQKEYDSRIMHSYYDVDYS